MERLSLGENMNPDYRYRCKITRCVDGDTVDAEVDLGFNTHQRIRFRLWGINTPERGRAGFHEATEFLETFVSDNPVTVVSRKTGKFGRWLGEFFVDVNGETINMNDLMIESGHAQPYMRDRK
jgi:micrococcal nuclease